MNRAIRRVAVVGSGVMGSRIAAHFAGIGVQVLLLDIVPNELNDAEKAKSLTLENKQVRNRIVNDALQATLKGKPSAVYSKAVASKIQTGNIEDDLPKIAECDWVIEVVIERLDIKQKIFERIEQYRKPGTLITSNTSGIPIRMMAEGRSEDFRKHFCGTHFFNPPRYLRLLEIIPAPDTKPEVISFLMDYGSRFLGKTTVLCKDTPAFIANRVGVFGFMAVFKVMHQLGLNIDDVDTLTGPVMGRPKSATFRTGDVVGLDTLVHVAKALPQNVPNDEMKELFNLPPFIEKMIENKWFGDKTGQGFYKKVKAPFTASPEARGDEKQVVMPKSEIFTLNLETMEYGPKQKSKFATLETAKPIEELPARLKALYAGQDKAGEFYRLFHHLIFAYASNRVPEIADEVYKIDDALKAGFGWELGAFESWDVLGVEKVLEHMKAGNVKPAAWVEEMVAKGNKTFYKNEDGKKKYYDIHTQSYEAIPGTDTFILLENLSDKVVWSNSACKLVDIGDDVVALQWSTKMNSIGGEVLAGVNKAVAIAEEKYKGLVIANSGPNFSAGANVGLIFMFAAEQEYDELDMAIRQFQNSTMRLRYSSVPVVVAPHGLTLGGGCEMCLHADAVQAAAESYIGLVELGVGLIPGGGGTKEMAVRAGDRIIKEDIEVNYLQQLFINVGTAKVSTSAHEAFDNFVLRKGTDSISMNQDRRIADAKRKVLAMYELGYTQPSMRADIKVQGRGGMGGLLSGLHAMRLGNYISDYDQFLAQKLAYVICGGDLSAATTVTEQYLLDLERETFLSLCGQKKTLERLQSILQTGKPLRN
ncbi:3-hydroxyacyl-CoA dehydrogenase/enoyl-CoA hydratase family protein [Polluticoccus soli]|uniref:3-hydroxyacyl-CoA dehydrogenase/enoyl-CoA hydratase family protein n=1 Tax=Polluticoccus soli TaxID=3034150 RepID=UPI0023E12ADF|nr:3-hydroxyacyl-CoA dehydrogenase/enoyl-CoA hydratase family protein [Flavipsychrobacter sp. JY13-12]